MWGLENLQVDKPSVMHAFGMFSTSRHIAYKILREYRKVFWKKDNCCDGSIYWIGDWLIGTDMALDHPWFTVHLPQPLGENLTSYKWNCITVLFLFTSKPENIAQCSPVSVFKRKQIQVAFTNKAARHMEFTRAENHSFTSSHNNRIDGRQNAG